jgi:hypothetical protein
MNFTTKQKFLSGCIFNKQMKSKERLFFQKKREIETRLNGGSPKRCQLSISAKSSANDDYISDNPVPNRITSRQLPGVYMILCFDNNKRYYGESKNVSARLSQHKSRLRRNIHEILELQHDFNLYGEEAFDFICLFVDKNYTKEQRVAMEMEYIARVLSLKLCYNKDFSLNRQKENNPFFGKRHRVDSKNQISKTLKERSKLSMVQGCPIEIKGAIFPSISKASRETNHSRDTIRRWLNDPTNNDCKYIDATEPRTCVFLNQGVAKPVKIHNVSYPSLAAAAKELGCTSSNINRLLRTDSNCSFF